MQVRMKIAITGTRNGKRWPAVGEPKELPEGEALELIANGYATAVTATEAPRVEKAVPPAPETRTEPPATPPAEPAAKKAAAKKPAKKTAAKGKA